ncbi:hypothetical protein [Thermoanaerobacterium thermosulfurigenes]|uniref:hypothetical protein n=1 Tax=Thermoanaerobacterium thermosulfurigenes TaxID=33950 RepID=UPI003EF3CE1A
MIYRVNHNIEGDYIGINKDVFKYLNADEAGFAMLHSLLKKTNPKFYQKHCNNNINDIELVRNSFFEKDKIKWEMGNKFTNIDNYSLLDPNLSLLSKGVLFYMLTKSNNWQFYISTMAKDMQISPQRVNKAIEELISNKYLTRKKIKRGNINCYDFTVYELPYGFELNFKEVKNDENNIQNEQK